MSIYVCRYLRLHVVDTFYKIKTLFFLQQYFYSGLVTSISLFSKSVKWQSGLLLSFKLKVSHLYELLWRSENQAFFLSLNHS